MKRLFILFATLCCCLVWTGAFGFTGLILPFSGKTAPELDEIEKWIEKEQYENAALGLTFHILFRGEEPDAGRAFTLLGVSFLNTGKLEQAAEAFAKGAAADPLLGDVAALYRVRTLDRLGKPGLAIDALELFEKKYPTSPHRADLLETRADLYVKAERFSEAAKLYEALSDVSEKTSAYSQFKMAAAKAHVLAGDKPAAIKQLTLLLHKAPPGRYTEQGIELFDDLAGGLDDRLTATALQWHEDGARRQAVPVLRDLIRRREAAGSTDLQLHDLRGKLAYGLFTIHANEESLAQYDRLIANRGAADRPHSLYRKAKILTRMGDNEASRKVFEQLISEHKSSGYSSTSRYQLALIDMEENRYEKAYQYFKWRITKPSSMKEYLTWLAAWCAYRSGHLDTASAYFDTLVSSYKKSKERDRYRFWKARIQAQRKDSKSAVETFQSINSASPLSYYGIKSYAELTARKIPGRSIQSLFQKANTGGPKLAGLTPGLLEAQDAKTLRRIHSMTRIRMQDQAVVELMRLTYNYEEDKPVLYGLAGLLGKNGAHRQAMLLARNNGFYSHCKAYDESIGACYYSFTYPRGFEKLVEGYAEKRNLAPALVYSLMHQESSFRPSVVSPAHAIGLMQIIPKTGREIAADLVLEAFVVDDLYDPEVNVMFGTYYLRNMLDRFDQKMPLAVASYNAGPDVVGKWARNKGTLPDEIFIEEIPYGETNNYVKKISVNLEIYRALYDL